MENTPQQTDTLQVPETKWDLSNSKRTEYFKEYNQKNWEHKLEYYKKWWQDHKDYFKNYYSSVCKLKVPCDLCNKMFNKNYVKWHICKSA